MAKLDTALEVASRQLEMFLDLVGHLAAIDSDLRSRDDDTVADKVRHFLREELGADAKDATTSQVFRTLPD
ncbi:hypothetical protein [Mycobacterium spongiae]|uniref:hypothetical protein n=1 Tax=Mycobacterium spongiae TaxID=886343 RepID=UPI001FE51227|nr:hypothetical protein [Mycobacterium spongiae]